MREETKNDKVTALYEAVAQLLSEGADLSKIKVLDITNRAGIGKGTAYDYFSSKEELIIKSLLYNSRCVIKRLIEQMNEMESYQDKFYHFLNQIEEHTKDRVCVMKCVQMLNQKGIFQQFECDMVKGRAISDDNPIRLIQYMIEEGIIAGVINENLPDSYIEITMVSKIISFMVFLDKKDTIKDCDDKKMQELLYTGMLRELS